MMIKSDSILQDEKMVGQRGNVHPQKFGMWISLASIALMFAGLTSAYIVRRGQGLWDSFPLPWMFTASTVAVLLSSITMILGIRSYKAGKRSTYQMLTIITIALGIAFMVLQYSGFKNLYAQDITIDGNVSGSFLYVIAGAHLAHILGGVIALIYTFLKSFTSKYKNTSLVGLQIVGTYWHFVDILWLYLFLFFMLYR